MLIKLFNQAIQSPKTTKIQLQMNKDNTGDLFFQQVMEYEVDTKGKKEDPEEERSKSKLILTNQLNFLQKRFRTKHCSFSHADSTKVTKRKLNITLSTDTSLPRYSLRTCNWNCPRYVPWLRTRTPHSSSKSARKCRREGHGAINLTMSVSEVRRAVPRLSVHVDREGLEHLWGQKERLTSLLHLKSSESYEWWPSNYSLIICSELIEFEIRQFELKRETTVCLSRNLTYPLLTLMHLQSLVWVIDDEHSELIEFNSTWLVSIKVRHQRLKVSTLDRDTTRSKHSC